MKILLSGATGQMGKAITEVIASHNTDQIVAGFAKDVNDALPYPVYNHLEISEEIDVIVDFSSPAALRELLDFAVSKNIGIVLASTGYSDEDVSVIKDASTKIPILYSGNLSLGVNVMQIIAEKLASMLEDFDIEIVEKHHRYKVDSPSGTAKMLFEAVNKGRDNKLNALQGRDGFYSERTVSEVGVSSLRGGNIVGEHTVYYCGEDEVIELKHIAASKKIFANGAIKAARFLINRAPGLYNMNDVLMEV
ncbi:4-hydroxy-tetrahydrodipicolinate reductase [Microaceticoccus formicicus]|uniref:4-hydroxy-tetrahydrodipicolinate reductase n=1 Tax=Microaceticoccus formicicus TaxID=3118105 RepID=UPI003CD00E14|nr:4-hydroxy-tetrahydrodipicolinate reductase [Peptoniphilaceae bacterium AMB_02]